jgi:hypothetical protein
LIFSDSIFAPKWKKNELLFSYLQRLITQVMTEVIPNKVKQIYAWNWVIPSIKTRIAQEKAVRNIQKLWKSQIVGHFTRTEYTDGVGYHIEQFAYDRYKNIYRAILSDDRLSITYQKIPDTFDSLIYDDDIPEWLQDGHPNWVRFRFNTIIIRSSHNIDEEVGVERDNWYLDFWLPFDELPVEAILEPGYSLEHFRLECMRLARIYNII